MLATDTLTVRLVHSVGGLLAEITGLPVIVGPGSHNQTYELAAEALHARYPELVIKESAVEDDQVLFWVERV
jgi:hypothetical protein